MNKKGQLTGLGLLIMFLIMGCTPLNSIEITHTEFLEKCEMSVHYDCNKYQGNYENDMFWCSCIATDESIALFEYNNISKRATWSIIG